jgi:hypothetical protein
MNVNVGKLRTRLKNWGCWLNYEADIAPRGERCISIESKYIPEAGEVFDDQTIVTATDEPDLCEIRLTPNVTDAEAIHLYIRKLSHLQQYALALTHGGAPCVMRWRRMGDHVMSHSLEMAEIELLKMLSKSA